MTALTLPGTIPGLLRRGSPVVHALRWSGVVHEVAESSAVVCTTCYAMRDLALDLTDPTGRAHAAWFATGRTDVDTPRITAPTYLDHTGTARRDPGACLRGDWSVWSHVVAHLNPNDDTRLPDGSRWVDAEALRLVCLHVVGVSA